MAFINTWVHVIFVVCIYFVCCVCCITVCGSLTHVPLNSIQRICSWNTPVLCPGITAPSVLPPEHPYPCPSLSWRSIPSPQNQRILLFACASNYISQHCDFLTCPPLWLQKSSIICSCLNLLHNKYSINISWSNTCFEKPPCQRKCINKHLLPRHLP